MDCPIFEMCMNGRGPSQIANQLREDGILTPTAYKDSQGINSPNTASEDLCRWNPNSVVHILERREYTGCTVNFKTYTNSIWDKKQRENPVEKQSIFYGTHEALVSVDVFDKVQEIRQNRLRKTRTGYTSTFSGFSQVVGMAWMIAPTCCVLVNAGFTITASLLIPDMLLLSVGTPG